jgi:hypothetical protein
MKSLKGKRKLGKIRGEKWISRQWCGARISSSRGDSYVICDSSCIVNAVRDGECDRKAIWHCLEAGWEVEDEGSGDASEEGMSGGEGRPRPRELPRVSLSHFLEEAPEPGDSVGAGHRLEGGSGGIRRMDASSPEAPTSLLHSVDGTGADERPDVGGKGVEGVRWGAEEPDVLTGEGDPREAEGQLVPNRPSWRTVPKDMPPPEIRVMATASWRRGGRRGAWGVTAGAGAAEADIPPTRPSHSVD